MMTHYKIELEKIAIIDSSLLKIDDLLLLPSIQKEMQVEREIVISHQ